MQEGEGRKRKVKESKGKKVKERKDKEGEGRAGVILKVRVWRRNEQEWLTVIVISKITTKMVKSVIKYHI